MSAVVFVLAALALAANAVPVASPSSRHVLNLETSVPADWSVVAPAAKNTVVPFFVALHQENIDQLQAIFEAVSDPSNIQYGEYMTRRQILDIVAPSTARADRVNAFLGNNFKCESFGDALRCEGTVAAIETVFETSLMVVVHVPSGLKLVRQVGNMSIPTEFADDVQFISPLSQYAAPARRQPRSNLGAGAFYIVPETLTKLYNISEQGSAKSSQGVVEFGEGQWNFSFTDLQEFAQLTNKVIQFTKFYGPEGSPDDPESLEATLDVQYVGAVGQGNTNWYWKEQTWMFDFTANLQSATDRPAVLSLSYAWSEEQQCNSITDQDICTKLKLTDAQYVARVNNEFMKIGLLGTTIVVASGDSGCHGRTDESCPFGAGKKMYPDYPAASPYVTSIGGTALTDAVSQNPTEPICTGHSITCATGGTEVTATTEKQVAQIVSGGGFSNFAPRPSYQDSVVSAYLNSAKSTLPPANTFVAANRGFPDVSALAHMYYIQTGGAPGAVDGTSCAAPVWAGIVGLLNAHRLRLGRPLVGFANPLLYQIYNATSGAAFQDITVGNNRCTESGCACKDGFPAIAGWDAATGLGTPNVGKIIAAMDALDAAREARRAAVSS